MVKKKLSCTRGKDKLLLEISAPDLEKKVKTALAEDIGSGDVTGRMIPDTATVTAEIISREKGTISGLPLAQLTFSSLDKRLEIKCLTEDGQEVSPGEKVAEVSGSGRSILAAERTALNFLSRLSGIATLTAKFMKEVSGTKVQLCNTRKTTPTMRPLEKYAVRSGEGKNHRSGLFDGILVKDNHISILVKTGMAANRNEAITSLVKEARSFMRALLSTRRDEIRGIEVEVENREEALTAAKAGATIIMLDNLKPEAVTKIIQELKQAGYKGKIEVSGGINLENVKAYARSGADIISIGRLTHSAPSLDFSLEIK
ncbi:MAG: carboxylating nicotinate-nucleotide diphosphorylase [Candidatus Ratteibacteria bacterium]|jgi:nicotinate-nucleotide pyrophosphorylase (carboxylating)